MVFTSLVSDLGAKIESYVVPMGAYLGHYTVVAVKPLFLNLMSQLLQ